MSDSCRDCMFYDRNPMRTEHAAMKMEGQTFGNCRRRPPLYSKHAYMVVFPETNSRQWCGEWEAIKESK